MGISLIRYRFARLRRRQIRPTIPFRHVNSSSGSWTAKREAAVTWPKREVEEMRPLQSKSSNHSTELQRNQLPAFFGSLTTRAIDRSPLDTISSDVSQNLGHPWNWNSSFPVMPVYVKHDVSGWHLLNLCSGTPSGRR